LLNIQNSSAVVDAKMWETTLKLTSASHANSQCLRLSCAFSSTTTTRPETLVLAYLVVNEDREGSTSDEESTDTLLTIFHYSRAPYHDLRLVHKYSSLSVFSRVVVVLDEHLIGFTDCMRGVCEGGIWGGGGACGG